MVSKSTRPLRERDVEKYLKRRAEEEGGEIRKLKWIGRRGAPDRVVMLPHGKLLWVELKAPGVEPEDHQVREHNRMRAVGQTVLVIDSYEGVEEIFT